MLLIISECDVTVDTFLVLTTYIYPGGIPYIRMIGMTVVLLAVEIGDLVFLGVLQAKSFKEIKMVFVRV